MYLIADLMMDDHQPLIVYIEHRFALAEMSMNMYFCELEGGYKILMKDSEQMFGIKNVYHDFEGCCIDSVNVCNLAVNWNCATLTKCIPQC